MLRMVPLSEVKNRFSTYLELSKREDIVVTKNGRPVAILHAVTDEDIEDYLFESDPRFIVRIEALRPAGRKHAARRGEEGAARARIPAWSAGDATAPNVIGHLSCGAARATP